MDCISPEEFVVAWQLSDTLQECQAVLSDIEGRRVNRDEILIRAASYRLAGVQLKKMDFEPLDRIKRIFGGDYAVDKRNQARVSYRGGSG